jgi:hypothetical protein
MNACSVFRFLFTLGLNCWGALGEREFVSQVRKLKPREDEYGVQGFARRGVQSQLESRSEFVSCISSPMFTK